MKPLIFYTGLLLGVAATNLIFVLHKNNDPWMNFWVAVILLAVMWLIVLGYWVGQQEGVRKGRLMSLEERDQSR